MNYCLFKDTCSCLNVVIFWNKIVENVAKWVWNEINDSCTWQLTSTSACASLHGLNYLYAISQLI